ncbi:protein phosphatase 2C domain-containing protein [Chroococcidiopsis thermalis]|uniref:Protein serine/threonine phosphatase n=1 Tax=Chroococcidiopsis thermalis (strain PCC 7203) TaxID=251229 RepID=K9U3G6_CHRTP|nr:protein phosphatase 2C domain-containing protein [Chroococcidiopsis thermalis]AFY89350.1 protein serine/threonine phosphatase [Chroococcidiopsis thermalis PCC 7203]
MTTLLTESASLSVQENICCYIANFRIEILSHLGQFADIHYFQATIYSYETETDEVNSEKLGLLRVGSTDGGLNRELQLRQALGNYKMVAELLAAVTEDSVYVSAKKIEEEASVSRSDPYENRVDEFSDDNLVPIIETESEYLEEEFYEEIEIGSEVTGRKLILLSYLPNPEETLEACLTQDNCLEQILFLSSQICQFFRYTSQQSWCFIQIFPQFIQTGSLVKFFDLTGAYSVGDRLSSGFIGNYCAPEIAYDSNCTIDELKSTYTVGSLLYQAIHRQLPSQGHSPSLDIKPIPLLHQIIKTCLSPLPEERFPLSQLLNLLVKSRQSILTPRLHWEAYAQSTVGLSRLQNEDSYGIRQHYFSNLEPLILGIVADGMGGMTQGDLASNLAVQTVLDAPIPADLMNQSQRAEWLISLVEKANECVTERVREGGTTLSIVLATGQDLAIAHVGDSRIYLLRKNRLCQLSEDHSMVSMLIASGQLAYEESHTHPDRNVLTKSLGSKPRLSEGYIQTLSRFGTVSMPLEDGDILILCSDGVWDLVPPNELAEIFTCDRTINSAVELTIEQVLARGAHDNATILALKLCINHSY